MALPASNLDREHRKFVESPTRADQSAVETVSSEGNLSTIIDEASSTVIYIGCAKTGSATSLAVWQIKKINIAGSLITIYFANGSSNYDQVWDDRSSLTYV